MAHELPGCFSQDNHTPVLIGCPLHGVFRLRPRDHLQRRLGCPKCGSSIPGSVDGSAAAVLKAFSKTPRLGQHLLQSYAVADAIARAAVGSGGSGEWVAEIGVGTGILTSALLRRPECTGVVGFEMDEEILKEGRAKDGETWNFTTCPESQVVVVSKCIKYTPMKRFNIGFLHVGGHSCRYLILLDTRVIGFSQFLLGKS